MRRIKNNKGFSLIEMLMVIAIIGALIFIGLPSYSAMRDGIALKNDSHEIVNALRVAQRRSVVGQDGMISHGVHFDTFSYTLFDGDWAAPVDKAEYKLAGGIKVLSGAGQTIVFDRLTGDTSNPTTIKIGTSGESKDIKIEKTGNIDVN